MAEFLTRMLDIQHPDEDVRLRGRNLIKIALGFLVTVFFFITIWIFIQKDYPAAFAAIFVFGSALAAIWIARRGQITIAGIVLLGTLILMVSLVMILGEYIHDAPFYMLIPIILAAAIFTPRQIIAISVLIVVALILSVVFVLQTVPTVTQLEKDYAVNAGVMVVMFTLISYMIAGSTTGFRQRAQHELKRSESLAASLKAASENLEQQVVQRTAELAEALNQQQQQAQMLQDSMKQQQLLSDTINALSLPMLPVDDDVLVIPLIGVIDTIRAQQLIQDVLQQIERMHAKVIILDVTGVAVIDTYLAKTLFQLAQSAQLLGASTVLVGIRPEIAQTLVSLNADFSYLRSAATLREGLAISHRLRRVAHT